MISLEKLKILTPLQKLWECGRFGQINCCQRQVAQSPINRPIWWHCMRGMYKKEMTTFCTKIYLRRKWRCRQCTKIVRPLHKRHFTKRVCVTILLHSRIFKGHLDYWSKNGPPTLIRTHFQLQHKTISQNLLFVIYRIFHFVLRITVIIWL